MSHEVRWPELGQSKRPASEVPTGDVPAKGSRQETMKIEQLRMKGGSGLEISLGDRTTGNRRTEGKAGMKIFSWNGFFHEGVRMGGRIRVFRAMNCRDHELPLGEGVDA